MWTILVAAAALTAGSPGAASFERGKSLHHAGGAGASEKAATAYRNALTLEPTHIGAALNLGSLLLNTNEYASAARVLRGAVRRTPKHGAARYYYGSALLALGRYADAVEELQHAVALAPGQAAGKAALLRAQKELKLHSATRGNSAAMSSSRKRVCCRGAFACNGPDMYVATGRLRDEGGVALARTHAVWSSSEQASASPSLRKAAMRLESEWRRIRDEALSTLPRSGDGSDPNTGAETSGWGDEGETNLLSRGAWLHNVLVGEECYVRRREKRVGFACGGSTSCEAPKSNASSAALFPATRRALCAIHRLAGLTLVGAKFSLLRPGSHIAPHCGPTTRRLRLQLPLSIPPACHANCAIRVAGELHRWTEGAVLVFDDSFEHEVWHNGSATLGSGGADDRGGRLVLIVDVRHPNAAAIEGHDEL
jgi:hypothetical protein